MVIKKGFFSKQKYTLRENLLINSKHNFFGLLHKKKDDVSIDLSKVKYIYTFPMYLNRFRVKQGVEFVTEYGSMYIPCLTDQETQEIVLAAKNVGAETGEHQYMFIPSDKALRKVYHGYSMVCEQFGKMVHKEYAKKESSESVVRIDSIKYFDEVDYKGIPGITFGGIAGGGSANSIEVFGLAKQDNETIYKMIAEINPKLVETDVAIFNSIFPLFKPTRWFSKRESLLVADWGILHKQYNIVVGGKKNKSRTSVVEYESIKGYDSQGFLLKNIQILGNTSILSQERFSISAKQYLWKIFEQKQIVNDFGKTFRAGLLYRWGILGNKKDGDVSALKGKIQASSELVTWRYKGETRVLPYERIYSYEFKKKHWYSFVGDVIVRGRRVDARAGEGGDVCMEIRCIRPRKGKALIAMIKEKKGL